MISGSELGATGGEKKLQMFEDEGKEKSVERHKKDGVVGAGA